MTLPDVILLNGTSSAGKSALAGMLQARLPFLRMGIDDFVWERVHAHALYDLEIDSTATSSSAPAAQVIAALETRPRPSAFERMRATG